jgi:hypothetical protein
MLLDVTLQVHPADSGNYIVVLEVRGTSVIRTEVNAVDFEYTKKSAPPKTADLIQLFYSSVAKIDSHET